MRASGWRPALIRFTTASMWLVAIAATFLPVPRIAEPARTLRSAVDLILPVAVYTLFAFEDRVGAWIRARPRGSLALIGEFNRISAAAGAAETPTDRQRIDEDLAGLDRFLRPETFEFI